MSSQERIEKHDNGHNGHNWQSARIEPYQHGNSNENRWNLLPFVFEVIFPISICLFPCGQKRKTFQMVWRRVFIGSLRNGRWIHNSPAFCSFHSIICLFCLDWVTSLNKHYSEVWGYLWKWLLVNYSWNIYCEFERFAEARKFIYAAIDQTNILLLDYWALLVKLMRFSSVYHFQESY